MRSLWLYSSNLHTAHAKQNEKKRIFPFKYEKISRISYKRKTTFISLILNKQKCTKNIYKSRECFSKISCRFRLRMLMFHYIVCDKIVNNVV